jgi:hypothetical protein
MSDEAIQARLAEIEDNIHHFHDVIESCRKGMLVSRIAISVGSVVFLANMIARPSLLIALLSFTAIIAGIVWLGANKSSREQALASLRLAQSEWQEATDAIAVETIGE